MPVNGWLAYPIECCFVYGYKEILMGIGDLVQSIQSTLLFAGPSRSISMDSALQDDNPADAFENIGAASDLNLQLPGSDTMRAPLIFQPITQSLRGGDSAPSGAGGAGGASDGNDGAGRARNQELLLKGLVDRMHGITDARQMISEIDAALKKLGDRGLQLRFLRSVGAHLVSGKPVDARDRISVIHHGARAIDRLTDYVTPTGIAGGVDFDVPDLVASFFDAMRDAMWTLRDQRIPINCGTHEIFADIHAVHARKRDYYNDLLLHRRDGRKLRPVNTIIYSLEAMEHYKLVERMEKAAAMERFVREALNYAGVQVRKMPKDARDWALREKFIDVKEGIGVLTENLSSPSLDSLVEDLEQKFSPVDGVYFYGYFILKEALKLLRAAPELQGNPKVCNMARNIEMAVNRCRERAKYLGFTLETTSNWLPKEKKPGTK